MKKFIIAIFIVFLSLFSNISPDVFSSFKINEIKKGVYIIEVDNFDNSFVPYYVDNLEYNKTVYKKIKPRFIFNAGFFELSKKHPDLNSDSFVVINEETVLDPNKNPLLYKIRDYKNNIKKASYRSEFRFLEKNKNELLYDIQRHYIKAEEGLKIKHSLQGGPMLYPDFTLEQEYFLVLNEEGIIKKALLYPLKKMARVAIAIKNNRVFVILVDKNPGMSFPELINFIYQMKADKAIGYDAGYSTSFDSKSLHINGAPLLETRKLKSFFILK